MKTKTKTFKAKNPSFEASQHIIKCCMHPDDYFADFIHGYGSEAEAIRRLREYALCTYAAEREYNKKKK